MTVSSQSEDGSPSWDRAHGMCLHASVVSCKPLKLSSRRLHSTYVCGRGWATKLTTQGGYDQRETGAGSDIRVRPLHGMKIG